MFKRLIGGISVNCRGGGGSRRQESAQNACGVDLCEEEEEGRKVR